MEIITTVPEPNTTTANKETPDPLATTKPTPPNSSIKVTPDATTCTV
jgi:hypothetical protein